MEKLLAILGIVVILGCVGGSNPVPTPPSELPEITSLQTFYDSENEVCERDGRPIVYMFSTTWCPHCNWVGPTFEKVAYEYKVAGKIHAYHWKLDIHDDSLTPEVEGDIPADAIAAYQEFNPRGSIPTFVFGCKYYRVGNGYERGDDLASEEAEFRFVIEQLLE